MKYTVAELKQIRNKLAREIIRLEDEVYECDNAELRADLEDLNAEYEYVNALIAREDPWERAYDKAFERKYGK